MKKNQDMAITRDRLKFEKNKISASLVYLAIVLNALFFASIYRTLEKDGGTFYYNYLIGISVLYNLVFMLTAFLSSEGVKNYNFTYCIVLFILGAIQIVRIFILPTSALAANVMKPMQYTRMLIYLISSSALLIVSGVIAIMKIRLLNGKVKVADNKIAQEV